MRRFLSRHALLITMALVCLVLVVTTPKFAGPDNLTNVARRVSAVSVVAVGQMLVIITGGIDLSVGSVAALGAVIAGHSIRNHELPVAAGMALGVLAGAVCGLINGVLATKGRIPAFIVTLGMMLAARGACLVITQGGRISGLPPGFRILGGTGQWWVPVVVTIAVVGAGMILLNWTRFGREIYATGGNLVSARLSGLPVDRVRIGAFTLCGTLAGFAGVMLASRTGVADPTAAEGMELDAIAACVVGGASLMGGEGGAFGALIGALLIGVLVNICQLNGMSNEWQRIVVGVLIIVLVFFDNLRKRRLGKQTT